MNFFQILESQKSQNVFVNTSYWQVEMMNQGQVVLATDILDTVRAPLIILVRSIPICRESSR